MPPIPRKQLLDALRAAGDGDFDVASSIIGQEKKDKK
jgi:hypothetical protein